MCVSQSSIRLALLVHFFYSDPRARTIPGKDDSGLPYIPPFATHGECLLFNNNLETWSRCIHQGTKARKALDQWVKSHSSFSTPYHALVERNLIGDCLPAWGRHPLS